MRRIFSILAIAAAATVTTVTAVMVTSTALTAGTRSHKSAGKGAIQQQFKVDDITEINMSGVADLELRYKPDSIGYVEIRNTGKHVMSPELGYNDGTLYISGPSGNNNNNNGSMTIVVYTGRLNAIRTSGVGDIRAYDLNVNADADPFVITNSGVGNITVTGTLKAKNVKIANSSVGNTTIASIAAKDLRIINTGVGNVKLDVNVSGQLRIVNKGVGDVTISGRAASINLIDNSVGTTNISDLNK